ncbi:hypothetical protein SDC9_181480 [bioreactor metagenome]|uniref:Uncharacterized protein n=1 Tax=bioreactor metagenome TaxID=1076179 RepID=A0A645H4Q3_9ZZZZ
MIIDQLQQVLVTGKHYGIDLMTGCLVAERGNDVISLKTLHLYGGNLEGFQNTLNERYLGMQLLRSRIAVGFVRFIHGVAKCRSHAVHSHHQIVGVVFSNELEQGGKEAVDSRNVVALGIPDGIGEETEKRTINQAITIDDVQLLPVTEYGGRYNLGLLRLGGNGQHPILGFTGKLFLIEVLV